MMSLLTTELANWTLSEKKKLLQEYWWARHKLFQRGKCISEDQIGDIAWINLQEKHKILKSKTECAILIRDFHNFPNYLKKSSLKIPKKDKILICIWEKHLQLHLKSTKRKPEEESLL